MFTCCLFQKFVFILLKIDIEACNYSLSQQAWKRLSIANNHLELIKELPPNFNIIILQHTDDR